MARPIGPAVTVLLPSSHSIHRTRQHARLHSTTSPSESAFIGSEKSGKYSAARFALSSDAAGLTVINDVPLEDYVTSVISSEMSASCPLEMLKAHAVISRSWLRFPKDNPSPVGKAGKTFDSHEILRWYGREAHPDFDVCADDHCQRYQGITKAFSPAAAAAVRATAGEFLRYQGAICDARFSKCCGGITERYSTAWEDEAIPYLESIYDGPAQSGSHSPETWIRSVTTGLLQY